LASINTTQVRPRQMFRTPVLLRAALEAAVIFGGATAFGFVLLVALFKSGLLGHIDIIFYRGVLLCVIAAAMTIATLGAVGQRFRIANWRDAFAAGCLSFGLNLSFLVIAPVTIDRSISVFMISTLAAAPDQTVTTAEMDHAFRTQYLDRMAQIDRRMKEQTISGMMVGVGAGYRITDKGLGFMRTARMVGWMFDTDPKLLNQPPIQAGGRN
jgi:hypothetical protein